jgi:hypothetical protein
MVINRCYCGRLDEGLFEHQSDFFNVTCLDFFSEISFGNTAFAPVSAFSTCEDAGLDHGVRLLVRIKVSIK